MEVSTIFPYQFFLCCPRTYLQRGEGRLKLPLATSLSLNHLKLHTKRLSSCYLKTRMVYDHSKLILQIFQNFTYGKFLKFCIAMLENHLQLYMCTWPIESAYEKQIYNTVSTYTITCSLQSPIVFKRTNKKVLNHKPAFIIYANMSNMAPKSRAIWRHLDIYVFN